GPPGGPPPLSSGAGSPGTGRRGTRGSGPLGAVYCDQEFVTSVPVRGVAMALLEQIQGPQDLKKLRRDQLPELAREVRTRLIDCCSITGGHIGASLGVVELVIALLYEFDSPNDKILWDVGHQAYAWKLLTGRNLAFEKLRTEGGLSGFLKRDESEHDQFGAGHAGTAMSAALGMATARDLKGENHKVVAI